MKKLVYIILFLSLGLNIKLLVDNNHNLKEYHKDLSEQTKQTYKLEDNIIEFRNDNEDLLSQVDRLKGSQEAYEEVLRLIASRYDSDLIYSVYDYHLSFQDGDYSSPVPLTGNFMVIDGEISLSAMVKKPPKMSDESLNDLFHANNITPIRTHIYGSDIEEKTYTDDQVTLKLLLDPGQTKELEVSGLFQRLFKLDSNIIQITRVTPGEYAYGSDYFPKESYVKELGTEASSFLLQYDVEEGKVLRYFVEGNAEVFTIDRGVRVTNADSNLNDLVDSLIYLPDIVSKGNCWLVGDVTSCITDVDVLVTTPAGDFECMVVESTIGDESYIQYFARNIGLVKYVYGEEIVELKSINKK